MESARTRKGQRLAAHFPEPGEVVDLGAGRKVQCCPGHGVRLLVREAEHVGGGLAAVVAEVVVEAGQFQRAADLAGDHLGADAALADQQAGADQLIHGFAHGGPGKVQLGGQVDLIFQPAAGLQQPRVYRGLDALHHLVVQRHWGRAVDPQIQLIRHWTCSLVLRGGRSAGLSAYVRLCSLDRTYCLFLIVAGPPRAAKGHPEGPGV